MNRPATTEPTRYELAIAKGDQKFLVCYSMRTGRHAILKSLQQRSQAILGATNLSDEALLAWKTPAREGAMLGDWAVRFTGRTQREAISAGELPWIGQLNSR
jgi:hypothetical protein